MNIEKIVYSLRLYERANRLVHTTSSVQDVNVMLVHALGQLIVHRVARTICNRRKFLLPDQIVEHTILVVERVVVHASLGRDEIGDSLGMLASDDRVVEHEVVERLVGVLEVELDHFNAVREGVDGHFGALCNRNELFFILFDSMARVQSQRT